jgi:hypothetical protein
VTAFGISAANASVHYHILTGSPLFDRAIMMSGSAPSLGPFAFQSVSEGMVEAVCKVWYQGRQCGEATGEASLAKSRTDNLKLHNSCYGPDG